MGLVGGRVGYTEQLDCVYRACTALTLYTKEECIEIDKLFEHTAYTLFYENRLRVTIFVYIRHTVSSE
jgi:hypothetical protein